MSDAPPPVSPYPRNPGGSICPQCNSADTKEVKYTWWGGILGPKLMNLQKCNACRFQFNRATQKSVMNAIIVYNVVALVAMFLIFFLVFRSAF